MLRKFLLFLLVGLPLCMILSQSDAKEPKSKWCFEFGGTNAMVSIGKESLSEAYAGKAMLFFGNVGLGTAIVECIPLYESRVGKFQIDDTTYYRWIKGIGVYSVLPVIIYLIPYSRAINSGNLGLLVYLRGSMWTKRWCNPKTFTYSASSYFDTGICYYINPWKFLPMSIRLGMLCMNYKFRHPEPYKGRIPDSMTLTYFYMSWGVSLGWWSIAH